MPADCGCGAVVVDVSQCMVMLNDTRKEQQRVGRVEWHRWMPQTSCHSPRCRLSRPPTPKGAQPCLKRGLTSRNQVEKRSPERLTSRHTTTVRYPCFTRRLTKWRRRAESGRCIRQLGATRFSLPCLPDHRSCSCRPAGTARSCGADTPVHLHTWRLCTARTVSP